jgi:CRP-like cAMP-binding protein
MMTLMTVKRRSKAVSTTQSTPLMGFKDTRFERNCVISPVNQAYWLIREGFVRTVTWDMDGNIVILGIWGSGDVISYDLSAISPYQIECLSSVKLLRIDAPSNLAQVLLAHYRCTEELLNITHTRQISRRLLKLLQWLGDRFGHVTTEGRIQITLRLTHQQLAEILGTTRVTVTRLLGLLQKENVVVRLPKYQFLLAQNVSSIVTPLPQGIDSMPPFIQNFS